MARHNTKKFFFGCILATFVALTILLGPYIALYEFFKPEGFWQRIVMFALTIGGVIPLGTIAAISWIGVASKFE
jgi:hypothetical protein